MNANGCCRPSISARLSDCVEIDWSITTLLLSFCLYMNDIKWTDVRSNDVKQLLLVLFFNFWHDDFGTFLFIGQKSPNVHLINPLSVRVAKICFILLLLVIKWKRNSLIVRFIAHNHSQVAIDGTRLILGHSAFNLIRDGALFIWHSNECGLS